MVKALIRRFSSLSRSLSTSGESKSAAEGGRSDQSKSEDEGEEEEDEQTDDAAGGDVVEGDEPKNPKLKRKKVLKGRRHHTLPDENPRPQRSLSEPCVSHHSNASQQPPTLDLIDEVDSALSGFNAMIDSYSNQSEPANLNDSDSETSTNRAAAGKSHDHKYANEDGSHDLIDGAWVDKDSEKIQKKEAKKTGKSLPKRKENVSQLKNTLGHEYFTLQFDTHGQTTYEVVPAVKGVCLREAVLAPLERRGVSPGAVHMYLAASNTPLPLGADSYMLGGNHLHVKYRQNPRGSGSDGEKKRSESTSSLGGRTRTVSGGGKTARAEATAAAAAAGSQRGSSSSAGGRKLLSSAESDSQLAPGGADVSPQNSVTPADLASRGSRGGGGAGPRTPGPKQSLFPQFGKLFDKTEGKSEQLAEMLTLYSVSMPRVPELLALGRREFPDELFELENHWTDIVTAHSTADLSKRQKDQQEALWELFTTEVEFIRRLRVILDLFQCVLINLQNELLLNEIETERVFGNVTDVYQANAEFWERGLLPVLRAARESGDFLDPAALRHGFSRFEELMAPYTKYCLEQKACIEYIKAREKDNELFRTFIAWGETQKQCNRLKLQDLVISPMQRLTKYKLLLKAVLKKTEDEEARKHLLTMIERVERFVRQVNSVMHQKAEQERLSVIIDRIEAYDVIDTSNDECIKLSAEFCKLDLTCPVPGCGPQQKRHLLLEGGLKLKDPKMDVYCFLFTDMLLVTKPNRRGDKVKVTKPPMRLDKIVVTLLRDTVSFVLIYLNEYNVASAVYTFHGDSAKVWVDHVKRSQETYRQMRQASMDRTEHSLMYLDLYDDTYEEDYAIFSSTTRSSPAHLTNGSAAAAAGSLSRLDSSESAPDSFLPTAATRSPRQPVAQHDSSSEFAAFPSSSNKPAVHKSHSADLGGKLRGRGARGSERRYHTADAITELTRPRPAPDAAIHKRLSWNLGAATATVGGPGPGEEPGLGFSSPLGDSLRSVPSSSGVSSSSAGSLLLVATGDDDDDLMAEEQEEEEPGRLTLSDVMETESSTDAAPPPLPASAPPVATPGCHGDAGEDATGEDDEEAGSLERHSGALAASKSLPNISVISVVNKGDVQDGIASVEVADDGRRKMSHMEVVRLKTQFLLNSTLEASDV